MNHDYGTIIGICATVGLVPLALGLTWWLGEGYKDVEVYFRQTEGEPLIRIVSKRSR